MNEWMEVNGSFQDKDSLAQGTVPNFKTKRKRANQKEGGMLELACGYIYPGMMADENKRQLVRRHFQSFFARPILLHYNMEPITTEAGTPDIQKTDRYASFVPMPTEPAGHHRRHHCHHSWSSRKDSAKRTGSVVARKRHKGPVAIWPVVAPMRITSMSTPKTRMG
ncbi:Uu.00g032270.m01.CDS01 [Anthostomella pinea]|uniref:Uu.00g032270.m01.CDS01 n=1 Tax=Anthostomella pinea TaxID=933095 RepID=A0AAI8V8N1_9PEZI|nr:Uu.00g032270.m01.CDS01 [Anthostomella pinea]